jgi:hypothetical protein
MAALIAWAASGAGTMPSLLANVTGQMYYQAGSQNQLDAYNDVSVSVKKAVSSSVDVSASCDNALSNKLETQPGFVRNAPVFYAGIELKL